MVKSSSGKTNMRSFTVSNVTKHGGCSTKYNAGRFISRTPAGAAKKAFNQFCRQKNIKGVCTLFVTVKETTQESKHKEFTYKCSRQKLAKAVIRTVKKDGVEKKFKIEYNVVCKKAKRPSKKEVMREVESLDTSKRFDYVSLSRTNIANILAVRDLLKG